MWGWWVHQLPLHKDLHRRSGSSVFDFSMTVTFDLTNFTSDAITLHIFSHILSHLFTRSCQILDLIRHLIGLSLGIRFHLTWTPRHSNWGTPLRRLGRTSWVRSQFRASSKSISHLPRHEQLVFWTRLVAAALKFSEGEKARGTRPKIASEL